MFLVTISDTSTSEISVQEGKKDIYIREDKPEVEEGNESREEEHR